MVWRAIGATRPSCRPSWRWWGSMTRRRPGSGPWCCRSCCSPSFGGVLSARRQLSTPQTVLAQLASVLIGLVLVALEVAAH